MLVEFFFGLFCGQRVLYSTYDVAVSCDEDGTAVYVAIRFNSAQVTVLVSGIDLAKPPSQPALRTLIREAGIVDGYTTVVSWLVFLAVPLLTPDTVFVLHGDTTRTIYQTWVEALPLADPVVVCGKPEAAHGCLTLGCELESNVASIIRWLLELDIYIPQRLEMTERLLEYVKSVRVLRGAAWRRAGMMDQLDEFEAAWRQRLQHAQQKPTLS